MHSLNMEQFGELKKKNTQENSLVEVSILEPTVNLLEKIWPWLRLFCFQKWQFESCQSHLDCKRKSASVKEQLKNVLGKYIRKTYAEVERVVQWTQIPQHTEILPNVFIYPYFFLC